MSVRRRSGGWHEKNEQFLRRCRPSVPRDHVRQCGLWTEQLRLGGGGGMALAMGIPSSAGGNACHVATRGSEPGKMSRGSWLVGRSIVVFTRTAGSVARARMKSGLPSVPYITALCSVLRAIRSVQCSAMHERAPMQLMAVGGQCSRVVISLSSHESRETGPWWGSLPTLNRQLVVSAAAAESRGRKNCAPFRILPHGLGRGTATETGTGTRIAASNGAAAGVGGCGRRRLAKGQMRRRTTCLPCLRAEQ